MLNLTKSAVEKIKEVLAEQESPDAKLRIYVEGGDVLGSVMDLS